MPFGIIAIRALTCRNMCEYIQGTMEYKDARHTAKHGRSETQQKAGRSVNQRFLRKAFIPLAAPSSATKFLRLADPCVTEFTSIPNLYWYNARQA
jgi:hypothetical protein